MSTSEIAHPQPMGIFGGTFDPIHFGHLRTALELQQTLNLAEIRFIPCKIPVHKPTAQTNAAHRLAMLQLAIADQPQFTIDTRELTRDTPSYMVETLRSLQQELCNTPLCLILGLDAFLNLPTWHQWQEVTQLAHFIIVGRGEAEIPEQSIFKKWIATQTITDPMLFMKQRAGLVLFQPLATPLTISATEIRAQLQQGLSPRYLLPDPVLNYIRENGIYT